MPSRKFHPAWYLFAAVMVAAGLIGAGLALWLRSARGFSCMAQPTRLETYMATAMRMLAMPARAKTRINPYAARITPMDIRMASEHFAGHCAVCHDNNGDAQTDFGKDLYPHPPDLRKSATQKLTDGQLYYIIRNGIRMSGMPAWSMDTPRETWELVNFIRHLPKLTPEQLARMKRYDPKTKYKEPIM